MNDAWVGKNALITGASRGLGREIARKLWRKGANVFLVARTETALADLQTELMQTARGEQRAHLLPVDLGTPDAVPAIMQKARQVWNRLDILINDAAIVGPIGQAWEVEWAEWQMTVQVNLLAPVALCRACVPWMIEGGGGKIVNLSGGGATSPRPYFSAYATAKTALVRFSEGLAEESKGNNIQVNCIAPGAMNTGMNQAVLRAGPAKAGAVEYDRAVRLAQQNDGDLQRAAELCVFLVSPSSDGVTGKLVSAIWDPWPSLADHAEDLQASDIYTVRRIVPRDRGKEWG